MRMLRCGVLLVVLLSTFAGPALGRAMAQSADLADHPLVGTWLLTDQSDPDAEEASPSVALFSSDGGYQEVAADGSVIFGVWEADGESGAIMTGYSLSPDISVIVRAAIEVDGSGDSFTAEYTIEPIDPSGESLGEYGPGMVEGTRIEPEEMGEPEGTFEDLFGQFEPEATPED